MPSGYTGVPSNVGASGSLWLNGSFASITIPNDGDTFAVSSVNPGLKTLTDYVAATLASTGPAAPVFVGQVGNAASTNYYLGVGGGLNGLAPSGSTPPTSAYSATVGLLLPAAQANIKIRLVVFGWQNTTAGGSIIVAITNLAGGQLGSVKTITAGTAGGVTTFTPLTFVANTIGFGVMVQNGAGVTVGLGNCVAQVFFTLG